MRTRSGPVSSLLPMATCMYTPPLGTFNPLNTHELRAALLAPCGLPWVEHILSYPSLSYPATASVSCSLAFVSS